MDRRRVLFITPQPFFAPRGSPMRVRATVTALTELGYEVDLLALPFGADIDVRGLKIHRGFRLPFIDGVPVGPSWRKLWIDALLGIKALALAVRHSYAVIHGIEEAGFLAALLAALQRTKFVYDMHSHMSDQLVTSGFLGEGVMLRMFRALEGFCMRRAGAIITVGDDITKKANAIAPAVPAFSLNDCPLPLAASEEEKQQARSALGIGERRFIFYAGTFVPYQGIALLLESFSVLRRDAAFRDVALVIVGGGKGNEEFLRQYQERARALAIENDVLFTGEKPADEVAKLILTADVLVSPRVHGTNTPLKIYSYMAAERPIVATRILSHTQVLSDENAFLAEPNAEAFSGALAQALLPAFADERRRRSAAAHNLVEARFSWKCFRRTVATAYDTVLGAT